MKRGAIKKSDLIIDYSSYYTMPRSPYMEEKPCGQCKTKHRTVVHTQSADAMGLLLTCLSLTDWAEFCSIKCFSDFVNLHASEILIKGIEIEEKLKVCY